MRDMMGGWNFGGAWKPTPVVPENPYATQAAGDATGGSVDAAPNTIVLPDERSGLLFVFRTFENLSYTMVMKAVRPISVGDRVRTP